MPIETLRNQVYLGRCLLIIFVATFAFVEKIHAQSGLSFKIPRGPTWQQEFSDQASCNDHLGESPTTVFGFSTAVDAQKEGAVVANVASTGPSANLLFADDVIVSLNGKGLAYQDKAENVQSRLTSFFKDYQFERGLYVYGIRNGTIFQVVIPACSQREMLSPFSSQRVPYNYGAIYQDNGENRGSFDKRIALTGFVKAKSDVDDGGTFRNSTTPFDYCFIRGADRVESRLTIRTTRRQGVVQYDAGTTEQTVSDPVDRELSRHYRASFNFSFQSNKGEQRRAQSTIEELLNTYGCASPEFKELERRVFSLFGEAWN